MLMMVTMMTMMTMLITLPAPMRPRERKDLQGRACTVHVVEVEGSGKWFQ